MITDPEQLEPQPEPAPDKKKTAPMQVVLYNLLAVFAYTVLFRMLGEQGVFLELFAVPIHTIVCLIAAPVTRKWEWLISAFVVAGIGFATCVGAWSIQ